MTHSGTSSSSLFGSSFRLSDHIPDIAGFTNINHHNNDNDNDDIEASWNSASGPPSKNLNDQSNNDL